MDNMTLMIDPETRDLVFDEDGSFKKIYDEDTTVQNVRHALLAWNQNDVDDDEVDEIIREAIFQEPDVSRVDSLVVTHDGRNISVTFSATLVNGKTKVWEVKV